MSSDARRRKVSKEAAPEAKKAKTKCGTISQLYDDLIMQGCGTDQEALHDVVWPFIKSAKNQDNDEWKKACLLVAFLVTSQEGKPSVDVFDDVNILSQVVSTLLLNGEDYRTTEIHLCCVLLSHEKTRKVVLPHLGVQLLHFIPDRRLELELKKSASLRRRFAQAGEKPKTMWPVDWINRLLECLEEKTKHGNMFLSDQVPKDVSAYVHRSLELLIDILSAFDTREFIMLYLDSIHFRCPLPIGTQGSSTGGPSTGAPTLKSNLHLPPVSCSKRQNAPLEGTSCVRLPFSCQHCTEALPSLLCR